MRAVEIVWRGLLLTVTSGNGGARCLPRGSRSLLRYVGPHLHVKN